MYKYDLSGQTYDTWTVLPTWEKRANGIYWHCQCFICGKLKAVEGYKLRNSMAGGCRKCVPRPNVHRTHGMGKTVEYRTYQSARTRCTNPRSRGYEYYGGRGVEFRFTSFEQFFACLGLRPSCIHSIDRVDTNGHYEPGNVRWVTLDVQAKNKRPRKKRSWKDAFANV